MNIIVEKQANCLATLNAEIPADRVQTERAQIIQAYSTQAKIPGFRPGKAPANVIAKRYQKDIDTELESRLIRIGCDEGIQKESLKAIDVLNPSDKSFQDDGAFTFKTEVLLAPEFELPEYKGIELAVEDDTVTDEDLERGLTQLQERYADYADVEDRDLDSNDIAVVTYSSTLDGKPLEEAIDRSAGHIAGREGFWIKVQEDAFLPGFSEQLIGMKNGETKEITITMPTDFPLSELHGKDVVFAVSIDAIKQQTMPELNDEFANKVAEGKTLDEVKELLKENLAQDKTRHINDNKVQQLIGALGVNLDFEMPQALIDSEAQNAANQMVQRGMQSGLDDKQIEAQEKDILEAANNQARNNLKTNFILRAIAEKEEIQITEQDMMQRIMQMAQQRGEDPQKFIKQLQKDNAIPSIQNSVLIGKTIDFLISEAKVETVSAEQAAANDE